MTRMLYDYFPALARPLLCAVVQWLRACLCRVHMQRVLARLLPRRLSSPTLSSLPSCAPANIA